MEVQWARSASPVSSFVPVSFPVIRPVRLGKLHFSRYRRSSKLCVSALDRSSDENMNINSGRNNSNRKGPSSSVVPNSNYVVPLDKSSCITRPLAEILRDLNKRIPDNIIKSAPDQDQDVFIPWFVFLICLKLLNIYHFVFSLPETTCLVRSHANMPLFLSLMILAAAYRYHANRMLSFYAPGKFCCL